MSIDRIRQLKALHMYGMAAAWAELQAELPNRPVIPEVWLDRLIEAEQADRQARSLRYQLKVARFPIHRDLLGFAWAESPLQQAQVEQLTTASLAVPKAAWLFLVSWNSAGRCLKNLPLFYFAAYCSMRRQMTPNTNLGRSKSAPFKDSENVYKAEFYFYDHLSFFYTFLC